jgi:MFS family permease
MNRKRAFAFVLSNQFIHKITENIYDLALPLVILFYTNSPFLVGLCYALGFLAEFLVGYFGGALVDSFNRRKTLITLAISQAVLISMIPILHNLNLLYIPLLLVIAFFIDLLLSLYRITDVSIIPEIVEKKDLPKANSYMQMSLSVATSIGPSLAGILLTFLGLFNSLWITFTGFILLIFSIRLVKYNSKIESTTNAKHIFRKSYEGLKYTWSNKLYRSILTWNLFINLGLTGSVLMIIVRLKEELKLASFQIGIIFTLSAVGGIIAGAIIPLIIEKFKSGKILLLSSMITALSLMGLFIFKYWLIIGFLNAFLMGSVAFNSRMVSILYQTRVPVDYLGRVLSASRLISTILAPVSVLAAGAISKNFDTTIVFFIGSIIILLTNIVAFKSPLRYENWGKEESDNEGNQKTPVGSATL